MPIEFRFVGLPLAINMNAITKAGKGFRPPTLTDLLREGRFQRKANSHLIIAIDYFVGTHHCKIFRLQ